jgi:hypothetical protein
VNWKRHKNDFMAFFVFYQISYNLYFKAKFTIAPSCGAQIGLNEGF